MYVFKFADNDVELEQIHRLNYAAFVEEIPQHAPNPERRLVDQFHHENTYAIALVRDDTRDGAPSDAGEAVADEVVAMLALRSKRPFSLDRKLDDLDSHLPPNRSCFEIRLLYIKPEHRNGKILKGQMELIAQYAIEHGHDMGLISGTTRQQRLYKHLGFVPFGPLVGTGDALFQPMYLTIEAAMRHSPWVQALHDSPSSNGPSNGNWTLPIYDPPVNYLPGPVNIPAAVMAVMAQPMISHRSKQFLDDVAKLQARLCALVGAKYVEFLFGSGTLGNEAVAGQLALLGQPGLILVNGEFGHRLQEDARRWQLVFDTFAVAWGECFDLGEVEAYLVANPHIRWLWATHSETSTGILNDLAGLSSLCERLGVKLCIDCISSLGVVEIDLSRVYLATATSGKALGAVTGLAIVFYNAAIEAAPERLPSYLDLGSYRRASGVPFTVNTNLVYALSLAMDLLQGQIARVAMDGAALRNELRKLGVTLLASDEVASPAVTTIALPSTISSVAVGDQLAAHGFLLSYQSRYLVARNWIQVCLMGEYRTDALADLVRYLAQLIRSEQVFV